MIVRKATVEDLCNLDLHGLGSIFYKESNLPGDYVPSLVKEYWTVFLSQGIGVMFLLLDHNKVIGAIGGLSHPDPYDGKVVAQEMFWFVQPSRRGNIGAIRLYDAFEQWAKLERKAVRISMACVCNQSMTKVRKFYEKRGFKPKDVSYFKTL